MAQERCLVEASVLGRAHQPQVGDRLEELARGGLMWTCRLIDLEVVYGARPRDVEEIIAERAGLPEAPIIPAVMDRAVHVAGLLAKAQHRGAKVDLVIAAAAEAAEPAVLHHDRDYERIAEVTRQPTEWVARVGTLDR